jgi:hypothetical protein
MSGGSVREELKEIYDSLTNILGESYRFVNHRPDYQRAVIGIGIFVSGALVSDQIQAAFDYLLSLLPVLIQFIPEGAFFSSTRLLIILVGILFAHQVRRLNTLEAKIERMSGARPDGGFEPLKEDEEEGTSGGGALGGAIAGAALGSAYGPGGTVGGFIAGAIFGDILEERANEADEDEL